MSEIAIVPLSRVLDAGDAERLRHELLTRAGVPIELDASKVERVSALGVQILIAAATTWNAAGVHFRVTNPTQAFREDMDRMNATRFVPGASEIDGC